MQDLWYVNIKTHSEKMFKMCTSKHKKGQLKYSLIPYTETSSNNVLYDNSDLNVECFRECSK